jgi:hypothetical protein
MTGQVSGRETAASNKLRLVKDLLGPYHRWVMVILAAMLVETAMSLAGPWPLKIILDNVVGSHKPPGWLDALRFIDLGGDKMELAAVAGAAVAGDRTARRNSELHRQLLYRERQPVGRARPAHARLRPPAPAVARLLRHAPDRTNPVHADRRRQNDPGLRLVGNALHRRRPADHPRHGRHHVLARLGLCADRHWRHPLPAALRRALQQGGEGGDARGPPLPERHRRRRPAGPGIDAHRQGLWPPGARGESARDGQPRHSRRGTGRAPGEVAAVAGGVDHRCLLHWLCPLAWNRAGDAGRDDCRGADRLPHLPRQVFQTGAGSGEDEQHHRPDGGGDRAHPDHSRHRRHPAGKAGRAATRGRCAARSRSRTSLSPTPRTPRY